ncbi:MAG: nitroreductase family protein [candidate division KSB1 bacterium]|nr:nitroreductase family protein [candidate division KSB1 bacterium]MDZ7318418.1 nitroreductase family protein [candidate division KSB1 bacterium]MDZ7341248.1 nitroreductase family protein [candidate division KSB1 bacterium]
MHAILTRRSIRHYTSEPIAEAVIQDILRAGMSAPSAGNEQPWQFVVIRERHLLDQIPAFHPYASMLKEATVAILVCGDETLEKHRGFWVQDCSAATENMLIAIRANELGSVWLGIYPRTERMAGLRRLLGIPEHIIPFALLPIGYPAETKPPANRFDPSRVHQNQWSAKTRVS